MWDKPFFHAAIVIFIFLFKICECQLDDAQRAALCAIRITSRPTQWTRKGTNRETSQSSHHSWFHSHCHIFYHFYNSNHPTHSPLINNWCSWCHVMCRVRPVLCWFWVVWEGGACCGRRLLGRRWIRHTTVSLTIHSIHAFIHPFTHSSIHQCNSFIVN